MSPAPDVTNEVLALNEAASAAILNGSSSSDELAVHMVNIEEMDLGSLAVESMGSDDLLEENEPPTLTEDPTPPFTTAPPASHERQPPVTLHQSSNIPRTATAPSPLPLVELRYQTSRPADTISSSGLFGTFFGCFKPIFSVMNKFGENIKHTRDMTISSLAKPTDDWDIPIDHIVNDLEFIGTGVEGSVFRGKLNGQDVAFKRVKSKEETNIKHLRKLNHVNIVKFRGISVASPLFYIVMEYCAYGSLYDVLKRRRESHSCTKPTQVLDWSRQIATGVEYLHANKIVHRDLKSPNILFSDQRTLKISDFGISKELGNRRSQIMSFSGTSAWMAPEVIRQEPCSEKIDVWSFGIVLWEILTCALPYDNIDPTAVMWGVGKGSLTLPIPSSAPEGFRSLMSLCWNQQPSSRPSFPQIIKHLDSSKADVILFEQEQEYAELTRIWSIEINEHLSKFPTIDISSTLQLSNDELLKKRREELQHIVDIRMHYEKRMQQVDALYIELKSVMMQLEQRERVIKEKERLLKINGKKPPSNSISEARKKSLELIKMATSNLNDPVNLLLHKKRLAKKSIQQPSVGQSSTGSHNPSQQPIAVPSLLLPSIPTTNQETVNGTNPMRRRKSSNNRRTSSKGSSTSVGLPNVSATEDQEKRGASINISNNMTTVLYTPDQKANVSSETIPVTISDAPLPSISAAVDSRSNVRNRQLNPHNLKLDLHNSKTRSLSPSSRQQCLLDFPIPPRKFSSSGAEDCDHIHPRPRLRRNTNASHKGTPSCIKPLNPPPLQTSEILKHSKNVTFQLSPTTQRKLSKHLTYTSSEEGEVEENHSDSFVLDDEKRRARHFRFCGNFSSESETYGEKGKRSPLKNDEIFSDEGGHVSDDRPPSRESLLNIKYVEEE